MEYKFTYSVTKTVNIPNYVIEDALQEAENLYPNDEWLQRAFIITELNTNFNIYTSNCLHECDHRRLETVEDGNGNHIYDY